MILRGFQPCLVSRKIRTVIRQNGLTHLVKSILGWHSWERFPTYSRLWREPTGHRWIPLMLSFNVFIAVSRNNCWTDSRGVGDLRHHDARMTSLLWFHSQWMCWKMTTSNVSNNDQAASPMTFLFSDKPDFLLRSIKSRMSIFYLPSKMTFMRLATADIFARLQYRILWLLCASEVHVKQQLSLSNNNYFSPCK